MSVLLQGAFGANKFNSISAMKIKINAFLSYTILFSSEEVQSCELSSFMAYRTCFCITFSYWLALDRPSLVANVKHVLKTKPNMRSASEWQTAEK